MSFPWKSSPFDKPGWNPTYEDLLLSPGENSGRQSRRKNTIYGDPCRICGQVIFGTEALNHHYNYHFLQNELASFGGRTSSGSGGSGGSGGSQRPPSWSNPSQGQSSAPREPGQMTLNDYLTAPPRPMPPLRNYPGAGDGVDMAHLLPLHPVLAQPPPPLPPRIPAAAANGNNVQPAANGNNVQQNQAAAGQRRQGNQVRWNNGGARAVGGRPAAAVVQQPPQDVIDLNSEENDCSSDGSEGGLDLTLSL